MPTHFDLASPRSRSSFESIEEFESICFSDKENLNQEKMSPFSSFSSLNKKLRKFSSSVRQKSNQFRKTDFLSIFKLTPKPDCDTSQDAPNHKKSDLAKSSSHASRKATQSKNKLFKLREKDQASIKVLEEPNVQVPIPQQKKQTQIAQNDVRIAQYNEQINLAVEAIMPAVGQAQINQSYEEVGFASQMLDQFKPISSLSLDMKKYLS